MHTSAFFINLFFLLENIYYICYMSNKFKQFLLRVKPADPKGYGDFIVVEAWNKTGEYMIDQHIVDERFPILEELDLSDLAEGVMEHGGSLSIFELVDGLRELGFEVQIVI